MEVIDKIKTQLQLGELEIINGKNDKSIFDRVTRPQFGYYGRKTDINYKVLSNSKRNFAVCFDETSCGMTCHYWRSYHNFNPQNGDRYSSLRDFFTEENYKTFHAYITIKRHFDLLLQIYEESVEDCFVRFWTSLIPSIVEDDLISFYFNNDSIFFDSFNLTGKNDQLRHIMNHVVGVHIKDIQFLLNDFGRSALITGNSLQDFRSASEPQLYGGKIDDDLDVYMLFREDYKNEDGETTEYMGIYAYKKYGQGINLHGKEKYGNYELFERNDELEDTAFLKFTIQNYILEGTWNDLKTNRKLRFKAHRK